MGKLFTRHNAILVIMAMAMVGSFEAQRGMFLAHGVDRLTAVIVPLSADLLTAIMASIISDKKVISGKGWAFFVMLVAGSGSVCANWIAGTNAIDKAAHIALVVFYLCGEFVNARVKVRDDSESVAVEVQPAMQVAEIVADEAAILPKNAPVSPAPAGPRLLNGGMPSERHERRLRTGK